MKIQERKWKFACRSLLIAVVCVLASMMMWDISAKAETVRIGTVSGLTSGGLNFRNAPGTTDTSVIATLYNGDSGTILAEQTVDGTVWYQMNINGVVGWATSEHIDVTTKEVPSAQDFEAYLNAQGFPESYKVQLRALHTKYPNWVFEAHHVGLTWDEVVAAENSNHRSLVHTNKISSWKSVADGDYNWSTGVWSGYDTSSWVAASEGIIKYHLDPRNFLDDTYVFQFLKQSYDSNMDYTAGVKKIVSGTFMDGSFTEDGVSKSYVSAIIEAGRQSGVSPFTIAGTIRQEQGTNGASGLISGTVKDYEGHYNYFNINAYQSGDLSPVQMGLAYAMKTDAATLRPWNTRSKAITGGAIIYGNSYINIGQDTLYLKKFDLVAKGGYYNHQYMTNIQAAASEGKTLARAYDETSRQAALVFKIPVFQNMPSEVAVQPTGSEAPNQLIQSISVTNGSFSPAFDMYQKSYTVMVPVNATSATIYASAKNPNASVAGAGTIALESDITKVNVTVTIPNVITNTYTLTISKGIEGWWVQDSVGWWYQNADGTWPANAWQYIDNEWYYFNSSGYMVTGWQFIGNHWYYLKSSGAMATGWLKDGDATYYLSESGAMVTGWQTIEGRKYFFNTSGAMQTGWKEVDGKKCYLDETGAMAVGFMDIEEDRYYFDENGYMVTGWKTIEGKKYYFDENGVMETGWKEVDGKKCYLDKTGAMVIGWCDIEGDRYYFDTNGFIKTGWLLLNNIWYYLDEDGVMVTGWKTVGGAKYYFDSVGTMASGWAYIENTWYYFNESGAMLTGWLFDGYNWFYLKSNGAMVTGWFLDGSTWYYFHGSGVMARGWLNLGGTWYYLHGSGAMVTGWAYIGNAWYYMNSSGAMVTGWLNDRGTWYYLDSSGAMVTNRYIGGYYVNSQGVWIS